MHHKHIHDYVRAYADKHDLFRSIVFKTQVILVEEYTDGDEFAFEFKNLPSFDKLWKVTVKDLNLNKEQTYISPYVSVCSGHHSKPRYAEFPGQNTFPGEILHSVRYKNAKFNKLIGKKVCLVGIGNSSVDIADNLITEGRYILL
jgi:dimethylaniline monooxygenase (N-oxide forming)